VLSCNSNRDKQVTSQSAAHPESETGGITPNLKYGSYSVQSPKLLSETLPPKLCPNPFTERSRSDG
jgi:hypothetical protein